MYLVGKIHLNKTLWLFAGCVLTVCFYISFYKTTPKLEINLKILLMAAKQAAENGGAKIVEITDELTKNAPMGKGPEVITTVDFETNCVIIGTLRNKFPKLSIISEDSKTYCPERKIFETQTDFKEIYALNDQWVKSEEITVWMSPLNTMQEYSDNLDDFITTMICVALQGKPIIGVIHKPFSRETFWAWLGNGRSLNFPAHKITKNKLIVSNLNSQKVAKLLNVTFNNYTVVSVGGIGYKFLEIINGNVDGFVDLTPMKKWDVCAGDAFVHELGGKLTTIQNFHINYSNTDDVTNENGLVASLRNHQFYIDVLRKILY